MKKHTKGIAAGLAVLLLAGAGIAVWNRAQERAEALEASRKDAEAAAQAQAGESSGEGTVTYQGVTYQYKENIRNYLFLGIDREAPGEEKTSGTAGQADAIFLLSRDTESRKLRVLEIPRDTMAQIEVYDAQGKSLGMTTDHLNLQYAYGDGRGSSCRLMKEAVSNLLYQLPISGYCALMMDGIAVLNDAVGGVSVTVPEGGFTAGGQEYAEGTVLTLDGETAEAFVRYRDTQESLSSLTRMENQNVFLEAWMQKAQETAAGDAGFVTRLYTELEPYLVTDMTNDLFAGLLEDSANFARERNTLPGSGSQGQNFDEYHVDDEALYELILEMFYEEVK